MSSSTRTLAIIGAGPLTGLAVARRFGREGFRVALVARRRQSLDDLVSRLVTENIEARGFVGDVTSEQSLVDAFKQIRKAFGTINVMMYSPINMVYIPPTQVNAENARQAFEFLAVGAVNSAREVFPDMVKRGGGTILFANGRSSVLPMQMIGSLSLGTGALRGYAYSLHDELAASGVYVGMMTISILIDAAHAKNIAEICWDMHEKKDRIEDLYGAGLDAMRQIVDIMRTAR
jgi:short-subunit dehydrogenase